MSEVCRIPLAFLAVVGAWSLFYRLAGLAPSIKAGRCPGGPHRWVNDGGEGRTFHGARIVGRFEILQCEKCRKTKWVDLP